MKTNLIQVQSGRDGAMLFKKLQVYRSNEKESKGQLQQRLFEFSGLDSPKLCRNTTATSLLGRGIRKVVFICGEIKDLVLEADKHIAYLEDTEDPELKLELEGLDNDAADELKRR